VLRRNAREATRDSFGVGAIIFHSLRRNWFPYLAILTWLIALVTGWWWATDYQFASEQVSPQSKAKWPAGSKLAHDARVSTLAVFLHPQCPCSRASIAELERLFANLQLRNATAPVLYVIATLPESEPGGWLETDTVKRAINLPGARLVADRSGTEAARFGALTSGTVMLFDTAGRRLYAGGITAARGQEGWNAGRDAIENLLQGKRTANPTTPVFGCRLCLPHNPSQLKELANADRPRADTATQSAPAH
jgi:hypothetical protein